MAFKTTKTLFPTVLSIAITTCLMTACGGGGRDSVMVRPDSAPPIPASGAYGPCPAPAVSDCTVTTDASTGRATVMHGGRQSDYGLIVQGDGYLQLDPGAYRFSGGTTVMEEASLGLDPLATLTSDVHVTQTKPGDYAQTGLYLGGTVAGNVANDGIVTPGSAISGEAVPARIDGNFSQSPSGMLDVVIGATTGGFLTIAGRANLDGTLRLVQFYDWDSGYAPLPDAPVSVKVMHADGGVFGQFAQWASPGLFVTGAPRYLSNDVFFDITAISAAQAMAAVHAQPMTVGAARSFDAALANAAGWVRAADSTLTATQREFLRSAGAIQRLQEFAQATRTFDSLSGHGYADVAEALLQQAAMPAPEVMTRVANRPAATTAGAWSAQAPLRASGAGTFHGARAGFDQWLGADTLLGASFASNEGNLRFGRAGGSMRDRSPGWDIYVRHNLGEGAYVFGDAGYSRHRLDVNRQLDLGSARAPIGAGSDLELIHTYLEAGRDFRAGSARLTPFAALSYARLHGADFTEPGSTGFELIAQPATYQRINALAGIRIDAGWRSPGGHWAALGMTTGYRQPLRADDDSRAAFTGAPAATFALAGMPRQRNAAWLQMNLTGGGRNWTWLLGYDRQGKAEAASAGMQFRF